MYEYTNEILQIQNLNYSIVRTGTKSIDFRITWDPLVNDGRATSDIEVCFSSAQLGRIRLRKINN